MNSKVIIRVDGSAQIGLGHLVRCIALAQMLKDEFQIHFISKEIPEFIIEDIISIGFKFTKIETEETFFNLLTGQEIVVLDNYFFNTAYQKRIKKILGCKLVCIDDLHDKEFYADLIINHTPGIVPQDYCAQEYTKYALGPDYALLRPVFLDAVKLNRMTGEMNNLLICFGGSDFKNFTKSVLEVVQNSKSFKKITVILGSAYPYRKTLDALIVGNHNIKVLYSLDENQMLLEIRNADLAIIPSSGILFEVLAGGCMPLICYCAENQKKLFDFLKSNTAMPSFNALEFNEKKLNNIILEIINEEFDGYEIPFRQKFGESRFNNLNNFKQLMNE